MVNMVIASFSLLQRPRSVNRRVSEKSHWWNILVVNAEREPSLSSAFRVPWKYPNQFKATTEICFCFAFFHQNRKSRSLLKPEQRIPYLWLERNTDFCDQQFFSQRLVPQTETVAIWIRTCQPFLEIPSSLSLVLHPVSSPTFTARRHLFAFSREGALFPPGSPRSPRLNPVTSARLALIRLWDLLF